MQGSWCHARGDVVRKGKAWGGNGWEGRWLVWCWEHGELRARPGELDKRELVAGQKDFDTEWGCISRAQTVCSMVGQ